MNYLHSIKAKWKNRRQYPTFKEMPNWLLAFFAATCFMIAGYFGFILSEVTPDFLREANKIPLSEWGWQGWFLISMFSLLCIYSWIFSSVFLCCNKILRERLFA